jgi:hypothetical protein
MKNLQSFEEFLNESRLNESWPFDNKKHVTKEEEMAFYKSLKDKKTNVLYDNDEKNTGTVKDKRFQSDNEEKAWELFEIWVSLCNMTDLRMYLQEWTSTPHDDIFAPNSDAEIGELGTEYLVNMMRRRSDKDVRILKKMGFLI